MIVDLRSDTVTKPTRGMLQAMCMAEVGDDVWGEDPSVNALEQKTAGIFGHEAGLFCPSGIMTNQLAVKVHTVPGDEVICDRLSHLYNYEGGGIALNSGASVRLLEGDRGRFTATQVEANINPDDVHYPRTRLVVVENTVNKGGGSVWDWDQMERVSKLCRSAGLAIHLDGARIFNALAVTGHPASALGHLFDSISVCLSKGLGAPVGSVLTGSKGFIHQARRFRRAFGGGMRQAGYLAAAGIYALDHHIERLQEDHLHAQQIAARLQNKVWVKEVLPAETNIIIFDVADNRKPEEIIHALHQHGILTVQFGPKSIRMVTHLGVDHTMVQYTLQIIDKLTF